MTKESELNQRREELIQRRADLLEEINQIDEQLEKIGNLKKPYVAAISAYSGGWKMAFATEKAARKKLDEYYGKTYFKNGLSYGVYLFKHNQDGTKTLLEVRPMSRPEFFPFGFDKIEEQTK